MANVVNGSKLSLQAKVSEKGAISIYGLRRFPVTLYAHELEAILNRKDALIKFMTMNKGSLQSHTQGNRQIEGAVSI